MSTTKQELSKVKEEEEKEIVVPPPPPPVPLTKINHVPLFWGERHDEMDRIEAAGYPIYYIMGTRKYETTANNVRSTHHMPQVMRVDSSFFGRAVTPVSVDDLGLFAPTNMSCDFYLPKMPYAFVKKMDAFFRKVHQLHDTEGILVLTFDPTYLETDDPAGGWGCIAPEQANTSGHCNYEIDIVMKEKPAHCFVVGTVHSHPEMSAFFSPTDTADQAKMEGLHITFGWGKASLKTEYHMAITLGGESWERKPEDIFEPPPLPDVDVSEIDDWVVNVSKKSSTPAKNTTVMGSTADYSHGAHYTSPYGNSLPGGSTASPARSIKLPAGHPDPRKSTIVACCSRHDAGGKCPFCLMPISQVIWDNGRCIACQSYLMNSEMTLEELCSLRIKRGQNYSIDIDPDKAPVELIVWIPKGSKGATDHSFSMDQRTSAIMARSEMELAGTLPK